jgi:hypothetical protein
MSIENISIGPMLQLAASGSTERVFNITNRTVIQNVCQSFANNKLNLLRNAGDTCIPLFIRSDLPIDYLQLNIGGSHVIKFPLDFCNKLLDFKSPDNCKIYKIPWELLKIKPIQLVSLQFHSVSFEIIAQHQCCAKLYVCYQYLENDERLQLASSRKDIDIKQFQNQNITIGENYKIQLRFDGLIKGIFIDNVDINEITSFELILQSHTRIKYDKEMLSFFTKKINNNCVYLSFDNLNFNDTTWNSAINFSRIENISIKISSNITQKVILRALNLNILRIVSGMGGVVYDIKEREEIVNNIPRRIEGDSLCPIGYLDIMDNDSYMKCDECNKNFITHLLKEWLRLNKSCPCCRTKWTNNNSYINI